MDMLISIWHVRKRVSIKNFLTRNVLIYSIVFNILSELYLSSNFE